MRYRTVAINNVPIRLKCFKVENGEAKVSAEIKGEVVNLSLKDNVVTVTKGVVPADILPALEKMIVNYFGKWDRAAFMAEKKAFSPAWNTPAIRDILIQKEIKNLE